jgi:S-adenosylmethionine:tRNA ribosyltransferase-isomerase
MKFAYLYAIENKYRFYSYGDTSLLWKSETLK